MTSNASDALSNVLNLSICAAVNLGMVVGNYNPLSGACPVMAAVLKSTFGEFFPKL